MRSARVIKKEVAEIQKTVNPSKHGLAWKNPTGSYVMHNQTFRTRKQLEKYADDQGFTRLTIVGWG